VPKYYPVLLDLRNRRAMVVGGNELAAEKATALVASGALVEVLNEEFCDALLSMTERREITLRHKQYESGDLAGAFVVVAVTTDEQLIEAIWQETQQRGQPVNIVDVPRYCSFILPSVLRRGQLTISVSTEGASPGMAKRIRRQLEEVFPAAYGAYVDLAALARSYLRRHGVSYATRDRFVQDFMASPILAWLNGGETAQALKTTASLLQTYGVEVDADELASEFGKELGDVANER
jgi:precorrin-2 dehydrogenase / sirohydrochlorin ferrochelatase